MKYTQSFNIYSIWKNIYNINEKNYYGKLLRRKISEKISIKDMYHLLMKDYLDIFHNHKIKYKVILNVPDEFEKSLIFINLNLMIK